MKYIFLIISCLFIYTTSLKAQTFPQSEWEYHNSPQSDGWADKDMRNLYQYLADSTKVTSALIVHNGKIVFEFGDIEQQNYIASCRKSVLAMLYGKYVDDQSIDLTRTLKELNIDDVGGVLPIESTATIEHLISSRSGIYRPASNPGTWVQFIKERGTVTPGTRWLYNNWDFNVAGHLFEELAQTNIYDEITTQFAIPMDMQDWDREKQQKVGDASKSKYLAYAMWFSSRDLARLGHLMLNKGKWNGNQLISEHWIDEILKERTTSDEMKESAPVMANLPFDFGYGYMWWLWTNTSDFRMKNAYSAFGAYGQAITVYPEINTVVVFNTKPEYGRANSGKVTQTLPIKIIKSYKPHKL